MHMTECLTCGICICLSFCLSLSVSVSLCMCVHLRVNFCLGQGVPECDSCMVAMSKRLRLHTRARILDTPFFFHENLLCGRGLWRDVPLAFMPMEEKRSPPAHIPKP